MVKNSTNSTEALGNTKPKPKVQEPAKNRFCMTLNNYSEKEYRELINYFSADSTNKWIIGKEIGDIEKTEHLQIYVNFGKRKRFTEIKKINSRLHIEACKGSEDDNIAYCSKDNNYASHGLKIKKPLKIIPYEKLYDWQKMVVDMVKTEPDDRTINWFWEKNGNVGKTQLCKYLVFHHNAYLVEGKKNDILFAASEVDSEIYIFDFERTIEGFVSYSAIEKIKNGLYMSGKYESKSICRNSPHIFIFANFPPETDSLSKDRWNIVNLDRWKKKTDLSKLTENEKIIKETEIDLLNDSDSEFEFE